MKKISTEKAKVLATIENLEKYIKSEKNPEKRHMAGLGKMFAEEFYLFSRNRPNGAGVRCYVRASGNPGGIGHGWVKRRFIDPAPPMSPITEAVKILRPDGSEVESVRKRIFVPSSVFDNKILMEHDPDYIGRLAMLPEAERKALLYGSW